jgi:hypothetical protein
MASDNDRRGVTVGKRIADLPEGREGDFTWRSERLDLQIAKFAQHRDHAGLKTIPQSGSFSDRCQHTHM